MIYLILCVLACASFGFFFKIFQKLNVNTFFAVSMNYLTIAGIALAVKPHLIFSGEILTVRWFWPTILLGCFFTVIFNVIAVSTQIIGVGKTQIPNRMSFIIPVLFSVLFYGDAMNWIKVAGICIALLSIYFTFLGTQDSGSVSHKWYKWIPIIIFICGGINDSIFKYIQANLMEEKFITEFIFLLSFTAGVLGIIYHYTFIKKEKREVNVVSQFGGIALGTVNFFSLIFFYKSLLFFESSIVFSVNSIAVVVLSAIGGFFLFAEKLKPINWLGVAMGVVSVMLITFN